MQLEDLRHHAVQMFDNGIGASLDLQAMGNGIGGDIRLDLLGNGLDFGRFFGSPHGSAEEDFGLMLADGGFDFFDGWRSSQSVSQ
jgi:hypothetical protein